MCNEYQLRVARNGIASEFFPVKIPLRWADAEPNRELEEPFRPTDRATILRPVNAADPMAGIEGLDIRWWMVPFFHRGLIKDWKSMATNARLESVDSSPTFREAYRRRRCLVPLTSFIEYDEPPGWKKGQPKRRNEIKWAGGGVRYFAGLWERSRPADMMEGLESFTFVTAPAPPDIAPLHDRTPPVLSLEQGMTWLALDGPGKAMLEPRPPAGTYQVAEAPRTSIMSAAMRKALP